MNCEWTRILNEAAVANFKVFSLHSSEENSKSHEGKLVTWLRV